MTGFEEALQECLQDLEQGSLTVEECLRRFPAYAAQLEPTLLMSTYLQRGQEARLSDAFKARVRTRLLRDIVAHPRRATRSTGFFLKLALGLATLLLALLMSGTAYAQRALPGEAFYRWKLASERAWREVSPDPVGTDLAIAERRLSELIAVREDPFRYSQALEAYFEVTDRLKAERNGADQARISEALQAQSQELDQAGIILSPSDSVLPTPSIEPTVVPQLTSPVPVLPVVTATELPAIIPTVEVPSQILPTKDVLPRIVPTLEIPPPLR